MTQYKDADLEFARGLAQQSLLLVIARVELAALGSTRMLGGRIAIENEQKAADKKKRKAAAASTEG